MSKPKYRRCVFYFHGFDRRGARYFNLWQKREARIHVKRHGGDLSVGDLKGETWSIRSGDVEADFHFMDWTRITKARFEKPFWVGMGAMAGLGWVALRQGIFTKITRADWMIGLLSVWAFLPMLLFGVSLVLAAFSGVFSVVCVGAIGLVSVWLLHRFDHVFGVYYALNIAWAARRMALRDDPEFEEIITSFQKLIADADGDEIVLVGHSIGGALAMRLLDQAPASAVLLTIGQSVPLVSFQTEASDLRAKLKSARSGGGNWLDVSAGRDPLGFSAFDPSGGGAACVSAHFGRSFAENRLRRLKWRGFDMHFLYFNAAEKMGPAWNWFDVLTSETALLERFKGENRYTGKGERRGWF